MYPSYSTNRTFSIKLSRNVWKWMYRHTSYTHWQWKLTAKTEIKCTTKSRGACIRIKRYVYFSGACIREVSIINVRV